MTQLLYLPANTIGRDFVVGDLHGCFDDLQNVLHQAEFNADHDRLFSVGDLIDRGPNSQRCIELLREPWFFSVRGNHEQMLIEAIDDIANWSGNSFTKSFWLRNGGLWAAGLSHQELYELRATVTNLPLVIVVADQFAVLHAEFLGDDAALLSGQYSEQDEIMMLWGRSIIDNGVQPRLSIPAYVGHTPGGDVRRIGALNYIDTGACFQNRDAPGYLTMIEPATRAVFTSRPAPARLDWDD